MIQSLDSLPLAAEIEKRAAAAGLIMPVLVQVNIGDDDNKFGISEQQTLPFLQQLAQFGSLQVKGLMTIGPLLPEAEQMRPLFAAMRELFLKVKAFELPHVSMDYLSMGMTHDYQIAVEEGANIVRVGSGIFGTRANVL